MLFFFRNLILCVIDKKQAFLNADPLKRMKRFFLFNKIRFEFARIVFAQIFVIIVVCLKRKYLKTKIKTA